MQHQLREGCRWRGRRAQADGSVERSKPGPSSARFLPEARTMPFQRRMRRKMHTTSDGQRLHVEIRQGGGRRRGGPAATTMREREGKGGGGGGTEEEPKRGRRRLAAGGGRGRKWARGDAAGQIRRLDGRIRRGRGWRRGGAAAATVREREG